MASVAAVCSNKVLLQENEMKYKGIVCPKHPELEGLRSKSRHRCLKCISEARKIARARDKKKHGSKVIGSVCLIHPSLGGLRYTQSRKCVGCENCRTPDYKLTVEYVKATAAENKSIRIAKLREQLRVLEES